MGRKGARNARRRGRGEAREAQRGHTERPLARVDDGAGRVFAAGLHDHVLVAGRAPGLRGANEARADPHGRCTHRKRHREATP